MTVKPDSWDDEQMWTAERYSPAYVAYLRATLPPSRASDEERNQARDAVQRSLLVELISPRQLPDGSWPLGGPPWFRVYPIPLLVLLEYGLHDHPKEYYIAFQGRCLQVMALAGLAQDSRVQDVASTLFRRQRWDGGWGTKPDWMFRPDEPRPDPRPSCWICTLEVMRGLGTVLSFRLDTCQRIFSFWSTHLSADDIGAILTFLGADNVGVILACLEFCANQGFHASDPLVKQFLAHLDAARGPNGRFPRLSDYYGVSADQLIWRLTPSG